MSKKTFVVVLFAVTAAASFAASLTVGVSASGGYSVGVRRASLADPAVASQTVDLAVPVGAALFADYQYIAVGVGVATELLGQETSSQAVGTDVTTAPTVATGTKVFATVSVLAEFPVAFGPMTLVPLAGIEGDICLAAFDAQGNDATAGMTNAQRSDLHEGWIKAGAELRFPLPGGMTLRPWFLAGYKLLNNSETSVSLNLQHAGFEALFLGMRAQAGVALGFGL